MKIAYVSTFNARDLNSNNNWAGTGYYIPESLKKESFLLQYIGPLGESLLHKSVGKFKRHYHELFSQGTYFKALDPILLRHYAHQVSQKLSNIEVDLVFSATIAPIAYLEHRLPIVFWADATFQNMLNFYPQYTGLCEESIQHGHLMEISALERCKLAIYSSEWAARTAIDYYKADPNKVKIVPFGANHDICMTLENIKYLIKSRPSNQCKLLFLGVDWYRKGGDLAIKVAEELNSLGLDTELTVVGCKPVFEGNLPNFVKSLGFISKSSPKGKDKIAQLLAESHFLIVPSMAECYGIVFCEANSFGVPCISRKVGGVPTVIKPNINGNIFDVNAEVSEYCNYIYSLFINYEDYKDLALSSYYEYESRLNWSVSGQKVKNLLLSCI